LEPTPENIKAQREAAKAAALTKLERAREQREQRRQAFYNGESIKDTTSYGFIQRLL
jgi:hypothetical protein